MSVSVFEHPLLSGLLGDDAIRSTFSFASEIEAMLRFEAALAVAEEAAGVIADGAAKAIQTSCKNFQPDIAALQAATARDGVMVPELVRQLREAIDPEFRTHLHFGATSQDVVDTALVLRLRPALQTIADRLAALCGQLDLLETTYGQNDLVGRTRMQAARPLRVADRIAAWRRPLAGLLSDFPTVEQKVACLQFAGATGTLDDLGAQGRAVAERLAQELELSYAGCWHTDRQSFAELAGFLSRLTGALGKTGLDVTLMAQNEVGEIELSGGGGSSAMAHKKNPVKAEILVALASFNATLLPGMHTALVHENERSGAAWTLEWMVLPQMVLATGAALRVAGDLLGDIVAMGTGSMQDNRS
ncbi:3-carboxy-cis,cis-muconate cycloisomerase [Hoeflea prorocentri]|uniref:3-carboxy-cis,cis-muconate cycloisomerase n=1 Tax=Hoeflea prorocentri TaxID=1922333 RepID=A0A9X3UMW4_9HYPH|nr:3-carboxy-cis,cis-muconate cycloisomerase [Hoeflea prorocentri]MCY6383617.1 3-carboxy-cis,cis-muconate cycloisomerase [Hoeflea prorocentri]MDA5401417.1 3-carboxy-cis,cis-muconate cycloisomerase [Hoeflea prorocentri]